MSANFFSVINRASLRDVAFSEKALFVLLFLFPIFSLSIRHWLSGLFSIITLLALFFAWGKQKPLHKEEKILLGIFGLYFFSILLSSTVTGWTASSYHRLGTELKYILFIPLYLYIRRYPATWRGLLVGLPLGGIVIGFQAIYDSFFTELGGAKGIYGPIIYGDFAVLLCMYSLIFGLTNRSKVWRRINLLASGLALIAIIYSGSRNAWLAAFISMVLLPYLISPRTTFKRVGSWYLFIFAAVSIVAISSPSSITSRLGIVGEEISRYFQGTSGYQEEKLFSSSVGVRLELWRSSILIIKDNAVLGIGPGNMLEAINKLVEEERVNKAMYRDPIKVGMLHVHNAYFEVAATQGILGILALLLFLFYPLVIFYKNIDYDRRIASLGILLMCGYIIFSLTEVPYIHDNFSSIFLIFLSVFFAWIMEAKYTNKNHQE